MTSYQKLSSLPRRKIQLALFTVLFLIFFVLSFSLSFGISSTPIPLESAMNMGFRDEVSGDRTGGWSDQGSLNDLRIFPATNAWFGGIAFRIVSPEKNKNRSVLALAGKNRPYFPADASVTAPPGEFSQLYLLHACSWTPGKPTTIGSLRILYADQSEEELSVVSARQVGDWWDPSPISEGLVVWQGENPSAEIGLYLGKFQIKRKPIQTIRFVSAREAVWLIVGASLSDHSISVPKLEPVVMRSNQDWTPIEGSVDPLPGSILDLSAQFRREAPAGKYGWVLATNGHFEFEKKPGTTQRFFGINLAHSGNLYSQDEANRLAERFLRLGYNSVRISHHDKYFLGDGPEGSSNLDCIDFLFHALKKRGIFITSDIFVSRVIPQSEIPDWPSAVGMKEYKALVHVLPSALESWKRFATFFMEHKNPYTGLAYKDDPALYSLSLVNEDSLQYTWNATEGTRKLYLKTYATWRRERGLAEDENRTDIKAFDEFLMALHQRTFALMKKHLRDLKVRALLTDANFTTGLFLAFPRNDFDFVDNHGYWDHPSYTGKHWQMPASHVMTSVLKRWAELPRLQMPTRIFGKPFVLSEFNYSYPNPFRAEGGPVLGAYAALQDWDGVYRWAYAHSTEMAMNDGPIGGFDTCVDPINALSEIMVALLFFRRDVRPATSEVPFLLSTNYFAWKEPGAFPEAYPASYSTLGLWTKIGTTLLPSKIISSKRPPFLVGVEVGVETSNAYGATPYLIADERLRDELVRRRLIAHDEWDPQKALVKSSTGEILLETGTRTFTVDTPRTEALVLSQPGLRRVGVLEVESSSSYGVFFASSMDTQPLSQSGRILLLHLTDIDGTDSRFEGPKKRSHESNGRLPRLIARGEAEVTLHLGHSHKLEVWACSLRGERIERLGTLQGKKGDISFSTATAKLGRAGHLVYEIVTAPRALH